MIVYRYFNLTFGLEALQTGRWKIGRMEKLNDPFDCRPASINLLPSGMNVELSLDDFLQTMFGNWGLLCYSEVISDPVIWSHYADSHQGLALGFDFSTTGWPPYQVRYSKARPVIDFEKVRTLPKATPEILSNYIFQTGFATKASSWSYEKEYRHLISFHGCKMIGSHFFRGMPCDLLKEVVLGARCPVSMEDIERVLHPDKEATGPSVPETPTYPGEVRVRQCRIDAQSFDLNFDTLPRLRNEPATQ